MKLSKTFRAHLSTVNYQPSTIHMNRAILFIVLLLSIGTHAQTDSMNRDKLSRLLQATDDKYGKLARKDSTLENIVILSKNDSLLQKELYDYYHFGLEHRKQTFSWNLSSSKITFWVVIVLVFAGIAFAGLQFYIAMQERRRASKLPPMDLGTQLEAGKDGIKVSSPVLGVIILIISLLFFYLYLAYVYPIKEIF